MLQQFSSFCVPEQYYFSTLQRANTNANIKYLTCRSMYMFLWEINSILLLLGRAQSNKVTFLITPFMNKYKIQYKITTLFSSYFSCVSSRKISLNIYLGSFFVRKSLVLTGKTRYSKIHTILHMYIFCCNKRYFFS